MKLINRITIKIKIKINLNDNDNDFIILTINYLIINPQSTE